MKYKIILKDKRNAQSYSPKKTFKTSLVKEKIKLKTLENSPKKEIEFKICSKDDVVRKYKQDNILDVVQHFTLKTIENFIESKSGLDGETIKLVDKINKLEKTEADLREFLNRIKKTEMDRLFKEIVKHDYERRFNTKRQIVISAMIGEENTQTELSRQNREERVII